MAKTFDPHEEEQLDQLKRFWDRFGTLITWTLVAVLLAQGQIDAARQAYLQAWAAMDEAVDYRRVIEAKLNALGVDPTAPATPAAPAAPATPQ
jgi:predicted negative regulator of RcsB-dependent stress response